MEDLAEETDKEPKSENTCFVSPNYKASPFLHVAELMGLRRETRPDENTDEIQNVNIDKQLDKSMIAVTVPMTSVDNEKAEQTRETQPSAVEPCSIPAPTIKINTGHGVIESNYQGGTEKDITVNVYHIESRGDVIINEEPSQAMKTDSSEAPGSKTKVEKQSNSRPRKSLDSELLPSGVASIAERTKQLLDLTPGEVFVTTKALSATKRFLSELGVVMVTGSSGDGKTALCVRVLKYVSENHDRIPLMITTPDEWKLIPAKFNSNFVVFIDDIFGRSNLSMDDLRMWEREFALMWPMVESGKVFLIMASRSNILKQCGHQVKGYRIISSAKEVALNNKKYSLTYEEKMNMLETYMKQRKSLLMSFDDKCEAIRGSGELGFPQICKFYVSSRAAQSRGVDFFKQPIQYLMDEIKTLRDRDVSSYTVLLLLVFNGGKLHQSHLDPFSSQSRHIKQQLDMFKAALCMESTFGLGSVIDVAERMCNVYIHDVHGCYVFSHQSIYETVVLEFSSKYPRKGIEIAPVDFLLEFVHIEDHECDYPGIRMELREEYFPDLARRILGELQSGCAEKIICHSALENGQFLHVFSEFMSDSEREELSLKAIQSSYTAKVKYDVFSREFIDWKFEGEEWKTMDSPNIWSNPIPTPKIHLLCLMYLKGNKRLSSLFYPINMNNKNSKWQSLLSSAAFVGDTVLVKKLMDHEIAPNETCLLAALASPEDSLYILDMIRSHSHCPRLDIKQLEFYLRLAIHCKKMNSLNATVEMIQNCPQRSVILETAMKIVFIDLLSKPGLFTPFLNMPTQDTDQSIVSSCGLYQVLLSAGATLDPVMCLHFVSQSTDLELLKYVIDHYSFNKNKYVGLVQEGHDLQTDSPQTPGKLISPKAQSSEKHWCSPLHNAAFGGTLACVQLLLDHAFDINAVNTLNETPLHEAARSSIDRGAKLRLLLSAGSAVDPRDTGDRTPLHILAVRGTCDDLKLFVANGADVNVADNLGKIPLHECSDLHDEYSVAKIKLLVDSDSNIDAVDRTCRTPLSYIAEKGTKETLSYLIARGADVNVKDNSGRTLLQRAAASSTDSVAKMDILLNHCVSLEETDAAGWTAIFHAADLGTSDAVEFLVGKNCSVSVLNNEGQTVLHGISSATFPVEEKLICLLKAGADVNVVDDINRATALHYAAEVGCLSTLKILLERKALVNAQDICGLTPLHRAAKSFLDSVEKIDLLLENGADKYLKDVNANVPLFFAAKYGTVETLQALVVLKGDLDHRNADGQTLLHVAVQVYQTDYEKLQFLLQRGIDVNAVDDHGNTPLHYAALQAPLATLRFLVENGGEVQVENNANMTPLHFAVNSLHSNRDSIEYLVQQGVSMYAVDGNGDTPLHLAADRTFGKLKLLVTDLGADILRTDKEGNTLLYRAAMSSLGIQLKIELLLQNGADINARGKDGWTLAHWSVSVACWEDFEELIGLGMDPFVQDHCGKQVIHKAALTNIDSTMKVGVLLSKGVQINVMDNIGRTALHVAAVGGTSETLDFLIQNGADVFLKDDDGLTALHLSVISKLESQSKTIALVKGDADINNFDHKQKTPLHYAAIDGSFETFRFLLQCGCKMSANDVYGESPCYLASMSEVDREAKLELIKELKERTKQEKI